MKWLLLAPLVLLSGCDFRPLRSTPEPVVVIQEVKIPVAAPCVPTNLEAAPTYVDSPEALRAALEGPVRFQLLIMGRAQRIARLLELEPIVESCPKAK